MHQCRQKEKNNKNKKWNLKSTILCHQTIKTH